MKKLVGIFIICIAVFACNPIIVPASTATRDSITVLNSKCDSLALLAGAYEKYIAVYENERVVLIDSIKRLNLRPLMTKQQFLDLYSYDQVKDYYNRCIKKPSQWKFIKSWLGRVFNP